MIISWSRAAHGVEREHARRTWRIGTANGSTRSALMMRPTMYALLLRKNSDDSTWIWKFGASSKWPEFVVDRLHHACDVAREIVERRLELEVRDDPLERGRGRRCRIVRAVGRLRGRLVVLQILGRDRRAHEDEIVAEVRAVQDLAAHRIEEGLRALGLAVRREQADVVQRSAATLRRRCSPRRIRLPAPRRIPSRDRRTT